MYHLTAYFQHHRLEHPCDIRWHHHSSVASQSKPLCMQSDEYSEGFDELTGRLLDLITELDQLQSQMVEFRSGLRQQVDSILSWSIIRSHHAPNDNYNVQYLSVTINWHVSTCNWQIALITTKYTPQKSATQCTKVFVSTQKKKKKKWHMCNLNVGIVQCSVQWTPFTSDSR